MLANLFGFTNGLPSTSAVNFIPVSSFSTPTATETARLMVVPAAFTLSSLYITTVTAPGSGKSYTYTIRKNQADTALTVTISDTNVIASDITHSVSFAAGDTLSIGITPTGTPTAPTQIMYSLFADSGVSHFAPLLGGASATSGLSNASVTYSEMLGSTAGTQWSATESDQQLVVPCDGTIDQLYAISDAAPGSGKSFAIGLVKNGVLTSLSALVSGTLKTGNDTVNSVSVTAGDVLSIAATPSTTPALGRYSWGLKFTPATPGETFIGFGTNTAPATTGSVYNYPYSLGATWSGTETIRQILLGSQMMRSLYIKIGTAPGIGKSRTFTLRRNGVSTPLTVAITDTNTIGNISGKNVGLSQTDIVGIQHTAAGTPDADVGGVHFGISLFIPVSVSTKGNFFAFMR